VFVAVRVGLSVGVKDARLVISVRESVRLEETVFVADNVTLGEIVAERENDTDFDLSTVGLLVGLRDGVGGGVMVSDTLDDCIVDPEELVVRLGVGGGVTVSVRDSVLEGVFRGNVFVIPREAVRLAVALNVGEPVLVLDGVGGGVTVAVPVLVFVDVSEAVVVGEGVGGGVTVLVPVAVVVDEQLSDHVEDRENVEDFDDEREADWDLVAVAVIVAVLEIVAVADGDVDCDGVGGGVTVSVKVEEKDAVSVVEAVSVGLWVVLRVSEAVEEELDVGLGVGGGVIVPVSVSETVAVRVFVAVRDWLPVAEGVVLEVADDELVMVTECVAVTVRLTVFVAVRVGVGESVQDSVVSTDGEGVGGGVFVCDAELDPLPECDAVADFEIVTDPEDVCVHDTVVDSVPLRDAERESDMVLVVDRDIVAVRVGEVDAVLSSETDAVSLTLAVRVDE
jgi:hypothetical protein